MSICSGSSSLTITSAVHPALAEDYYTWRSTHVSTALLTCFARLVVYFSPFPLLLICGSLVPPHYCTTAPHTQPPSQSLSAQHVRLHTSAIQVYSRPICRQGMVYQIPTNSRTMPGKRHCRVRNTVYATYVAHNADSPSREYRLDANCGS